jgi:hypothetical protein
LERRAGEVPRDIVRMPGAFTIEDVTETFEGCGAPDYAAGDASCDNFACASRISHSDPPNRIAVFDA